MVILKKFCTGALFVALFGFSGSINCSMSPVLRGLLEESRELMEKRKVLFEKSNPEREKLDRYFYSEVVEAEFKALLENSGVHSVGYPKVGDECDSFDGCVSFPGNIFCSECCPSKKISAAFKDKHGNEKFGRFRKRLSILRKRGIIALRGAQTEGEKKLVEKNKRKLKELNESSGMSKIDEEIRFVQYKMAKVSPVLSVNLIFSDSEKQEFERRLQEEKK